MRPDDAAGQKRAEWLVKNNTTHSVTNTAKRTGVQLVRAAHSVGVLIHTPSQLAPRTCCTLTTRATNPEASSRLVYRSAWSRETQKGCLEQAPASC